MQAPPLNSGHSAQGFTLAEVMVASALAAVLFAAVLSTFIMVGRSGMALANYSEMDGEARLALETFARDIRQAESITWNSSTSITIKVADKPVTYALTYHEPAQEWQFRRDTQLLIQGVDAESFKLTGYQVAFEEMEIEGDEEDFAEQRPVALDLTDLAQASRETKQLQLELRSSRARSWLARSSNAVVSARYILRNKRVTS